MGLLILALWAAPAAAQPPVVGPVPCPRCIVLEGDAPALGALRGPAGFGDVDVVIARPRPSGEALAGLLRDLRAGASRPWLVAAVDDPIPPRDGLVPLEGVLLEAAATGSADERAFRVKEAASGWRGARPGLAVGLRGDAATLAALAAFDLAPYLDLVFLDDRADATMPEALGGVPSWRRARTRDGAALVASGDPARPVVVRLEPGDEGLVAAVRAAALPPDAEVSAARPLTVDEVIARHQAVRASQDRAIRRVISSGTTVLTFEVPGFVAPVTVSAKTRVFRGESVVDVEQREIRVNGLELGSDSRGPRLPLVEPERITTPPLELTLDARYTYRLAGRERESGLDCYVVEYTPRDPSVPALSGRAWIDAGGFALVRSRAVQTGLAGSIVSSEQDDRFAPVEVAGRTWWLPSRTSVWQVFDGAGYRTPIHREVVLDAHDVNPPDFDARLDAAHGSDTVMLRDTPEGFRYLERAPDAPAGARREVAAGRGTKVRTLVGGVIIDPNISVPLPYAGISYVDLDLFGTGTELNVFFGGTYGQVSVNRRRLFGTPLQFTAEATGIAVSYNDRSFRQGVERYEENITQRPFRATAAVVAPLTPRVRVRARYELDYNAYQAADTTSAAFVVPADAVVHGLRLSLEAQQGPWAAGVWWNPARRQGWRAWGPRGANAPEDTRGFQRYGVQLARALKVSPRWLARVEAAWMAGTDLDRFSRFGFGTIENQLHGYPAASVRYDRGGVVRSVLTWSAGGLLRVDGFADVGVVRDPAFDNATRAYPGFGLAAEIPLPRGILVAAEWGYGVRGLDDRGREGTHVIRLSAYKVF